MSEFEIKQERMLALLEQRGLDALLLQRVSSFAWATCGHPSYINTAASDGVASLLVAPGKKALFTNNIEAPRLEQEDRLVEQGWEIISKPWYDPSDLVTQFTRGQKVGADTPLAGYHDLSTEIARLRSHLTAQEGERFRSLGGLCAKAMQQVMDSIRPGQTEQEIGARLAWECEQRGVQPIAIMVASDDRLLAFRHPLPTEKKLERYGMVILCGRKWGLVASVTRLVHFGLLPAEVRRKAEAVARIDAAFIANTYPGQTLATVFEKACQAYANEGYPLEWQRHHQGGPAGYEPREFVAVPGLTEPVVSGQAYAWNPSISGAKSEDTILIGEESFETLTAVQGWPILEVEYGGRLYQRPAILEII
jgi:antitoxin VapB